MDSPNPSSSSAASTHTGSNGATATIPPNLKFLVTNIKNLAPNPLTADNYHLWSVQILKQFTANGFAGHLLGSIQAPLDSNSADYAQWLIIDSNLLSALFCTVSQTILPYIITSSTAHEAWTVLERRLQPTSRSRVIQLKNELYRMQMKDLTVQQYLTRIKTIVDNISASGSKIEPEDVMLHILNGLPPNYNSFKSTIRNSLLPIDLDTFYALLCNEEIHLQQENQSDLTQPAAFYAASTNSSRTRTNNNNNRRFNKPKPQPQNPPTLGQQPNASVSQPVNRPTCQICGKIGHIALNCWHRNNPRYAPTDTRQPRALFANSTAPVSQDWILDSGASTHLTPDASNLHYSTSYHGADTISTSNGTSIPINSAVKGM
ncbi:hypothetical protein KFK09_003299 [Dendrobium nobile]|uniref:CCHC-type domain-containing protein n=1 Tax=Dendrobium nobile TaxID=94219 RepID=A0A8T3C434_DENNO|nr:hypothetical protein KFK09_003299 [Dendrobium nobile]